MLFCDHSATEESRVITIHHETAEKSEQSLAYRDFEAKDSWSCCLKNSITKVLNQFYSVFKQAVQTSVILFRITIPILIVTRILSELGMIEHLGRFLAPLMELVGLPGSMGLVWATAMMTNLYTGMVVFASLAPTESLTVAQVTVLSTMMLVAHALPVELRIAQKAGPRFRVMITLRLVSAITLGFILFYLYNLTGSLQAESTQLWKSEVQHSSWIQWGIREIRNLGYVFIVIFCLIGFMRLLEVLRITDLMTALLKPVLNLLGISKDAAPLTIIGMTVGIGYGGGLLIREAQKGNLGSRDLFFSFCLMGLCHSIIEDTLLMMVMGGHVSGVLWARIAFALVVTFVLVKLLSAIPSGLFYRFFFRSKNQAC